MVMLIGRKEGMSQVFDEDGSVIPVTVLKVESNFVVRKKKFERDGYDSVVLAHGEQKKSRLRKADLGQFVNQDAARSFLKEVRGMTLDCSEGDFLDLEVFSGVRYVDVTGISKGKGFQGAMKRHGFSGGPASHGSKFHRALGSTGQSASPSRTYKGRKMPGRMGGNKQTTQNLKVVMVDSEKQMLVLCGAVPGSRGSRVLIKLAKKKR